MQIMSFPSMQVHLYESIQFGYRAVWLGQSELLHIQFGFVGWSCDCCGNAVVLPSKST